MKADVQPGDRIKIVISDCHLSAGRFFEGRLNPHEDFHFDDEMADMIRYFGEYPVDVELIINGDFLDFLNVTHQGEFEDAVNEQVAFQKAEKIIAGHPTVMKAIRNFASLPGKTVTYLMGNHDFDLIFPSVRDRITKEWDPQGRAPSEKVRILTEVDRIVYPEGVEIHHGQQHDPGNELDLKEPLVRSYFGDRVLNLPWGSIYVLKIVNRMKWEREHLDKVRPVKLFIFMGLLMDPLFTIRFVFLTSFYFVKTKLFPGSVPFRIAGIGKMFREMFSLVGRDARVVMDLEPAARRLLDQTPSTRLVVFGHTHRPMNKVFPDGKQYINTGTWTRMIDLDWRAIGRSFRRTFAYIRIRDGEVQADLRHWVGEHSPHQAFGG